MSKNRRADIFEKKREAQRTELQEDYVEMIAQLIDKKGEARGADLAEAFGVSTAAVNGAIARLKKDGLVHSAPYRSVFLTAEGEKLARACAERHEMVVNFLMCLGVSRENAEQDAEGMEHYLSDETMECLDEFIRNNPSAGKKIN